MNPNCFQIYFQPIYIYVKRALNIALENDYMVARLSFIYSLIVHSVLAFFKVNPFGVNNILVALVLGTVLVNTYYGIKKSKKQSLEAYLEAQKLSIDTPEYRKFMKIHELKKFDPKRLQFVMFKSITLLAYLFFAKQLVSSGIEDGVVVGVTLQAFTKVPLTFFWYSEFVSIGENSTYYYGRQSQIFPIVSYIFELKFREMIKPRKTIAND